MSKKNSSAAKAARREVRGAKQQVTPVQAQSPLTNENNQELPPPENDTVGVIVQYVKRSGESVSLFFQTDREEFYETAERLNGSVDLKEQQALWVRKLLQIHLGFFPIDQDYFTAAVLTITAKPICTINFNEHKDAPVGFSILIYEGSFIVRVLGMDYNIWLKVIDHSSKKNKLISSHLN